MDGTYYGIVALGDTLYGMVPTISSDVPTDADSQPTYRIYDSNGLMTGGTGTTASISGQTGLYDFSHAITAGNGYASGKTYFVWFAWEFSSTAAAFLGTFTVV